MCQPRPKLEVNQMVNDTLQLLRDRLESMKLETGLDNNLLLLLFSLGKQVGRHQEHYDVPQQGHARALVYSALTDLRRQIQPPASAATREGVEAFYQIAMSAFTAGELDPIDEQQR